jgi:hypothetical protein
LRLEPAAQRGGGFQPSSADSRRLEAAATNSSTLTLFMARIALAHHVDHAAAAHDFALPTDPFDAGANFHRECLTQNAARLAESESI